MKKIVDGIHTFQRDVFGQDQKLFEKLAEGQQPLALFITCSDSRISPNLITQTKPGELFILRTAGNIVPPYGAVEGGEAGTIEYAVAALKVKDIIVCGHSHCGAMAGLLNPAALETLPAVRELLKHADSTRRIVEENYEHVDDPAERLTVTVEENVLVQLENLRTHPTVAAALGRKSLNLHGWVYKFETGGVYAFDHDKREFAALGDSSPSLPGGDRNLPVV